MVLFGSMVYSTVAAAGAGDHIRVGAATIAPDLGLGVEFRSNVYRAVGEGQTGNADDRVQPGANFRLSPGLKIDVEAPVIHLGFDGRYDLRKYMTPGHENLDRFSDFDATLGAEIMPTGVFGVNLSNAAAIRNFESDTPTLDSALITMIRTQVLPATLRYQAELADVVASTQAAGVDCMDTEESLRQIVNLGSEMQAGINTITTALSKAPSDTTKHSQHAHDKLLPAMEAIRQASDAVESMLPAELWPLPTYAQMLLLDR